MYFPSLTLVVCLTSIVTSVVCVAKPAPEVRDNPKGIKLVAALKAGKLRGWVNATSSARVGVNFKIDISGLPGNDKSEFKYHIHVNRVPADGNCTATGGHFDPFQRTDKPACDSTKPETCEVGDLSGKHGTVSGPEAYKIFNDPFSSVVKNNPAYISDKSIVIHDGTGARIACANFNHVEPSKTGCAVEK